jgi:acyl carrier protein
MAELSYHTRFSNYRDLNFSDPNNYNYNGPPLPEHIVLQFRKHLIRDKIFGTTVIGAIGKNAYSDQYIREICYGDPNGEIKNSLRYLRESKQKYSEQKFERTTVPFTEMKTTLAQIRWVLHFKFNFPYYEIRPEMEFIREFKFDSFEMISMFVEVEHYFGVKIDFEDVEEGKICTIQDMMDYLDIRRGKKPGQNLYPDGTLYPAYPKLNPIYPAVYPSKNLFRSSLV